MKFSMKKAISLGLTLVMALAISVPVFAANDSGNQRKQLTNCDRITIAPEAHNIPQHIIDDIVKANPDCAITIYNWVEATPNVAPRIVLPGKITKTTTATNALQSDKFVISVARGSTKKLTTTWRGSLSASCSDAIVKLSLSLNGTIERTYTTEITFNGPPEGSSYNSRYYGVKFYEDRGTFKETDRCTDMGQKLPDKSGTWTSPKYYLEYSVDKRV